MSYIFQELWDATQRGSFLSASSFLALFCLFPSSNDAVHGKERGRSRPSSHSEGFIAEDCLLPVIFELSSNVLLFFSPLPRANHEVRHNDTMHQFKWNTKRVLRPVTAQSKVPQLHRNHEQRSGNTLCSFWDKIESQVLKPSSFRTVFLGSTQSLPAHAPAVPYENLHPESSSQIISPYDSTLYNTVS